jgi:hypothetical protein
VRGTDADPGKGDADSVSRAATARREAGDDVLRRVMTLESAGAEVRPGAWHGAAAEAFLGALGPVVDDVRLLASTLEAQSEALSTYASAVRDCAERRDELVLRRRAAEARMRAATAAQVTEMLETGPAASWPGLSSATPSIIGSAELAAAETELAVVERLWVELVADREAADRRCSAALDSRECRGPLAVLRLDPAGGGGGVARVADLVAVLDQLSAGDVVALLATRPDLVRLLDEADPRDVARWWSTLADPREAGLGPSGAQLALVASLPTVIGSLDGVPVAARVLANARVAEERIRRLDARLESLGRQRPPHPDLASLLAELQTEKAYLGRAVGPDAAVQLYLYEPGGRRVVEVVGDVGARPTDVVTYVPGTYSDLDGFWRGEPQQVVEYLIGNAAPGRTALGFVYKDGPFPGERGPVTAFDISVIQEANTETTALRAGERLADFQAGLVATGQFDDSSATAVGHSWGLANVTASEVAGARYGRVASLAGAGMPSAWRPAPGTSYVDMSYNDPLGLAQRAGLVWSGKVPREEDAFHHDGLYDSPFGNAPSPDNHALVAQDRPENDAVLSDLRDFVFEGRR